MLAYKGRKIRHVPLGGQHRRAAERLPGRACLNRPGHDDHPLFVNQHGNKLAPRRIAWIIGGIGGPGRMTRHWPTPLSARTYYAIPGPCISTMVGVPLPYIRDLLGHAELATTDIYARASTEAKRKALEAAYTDVVVTDDLPEWNQDAGLLDWLASL